jgi:cell division inhibitor SepF
MKELWQKALGYLGLADEKDEEEFEDYEEEPYQSTSSTVRKISRTPDLTRVERVAALRSVRQAQRQAQAQVAQPATVITEVNRVEPRTFNDAQQIADKFKSRVPVIVNLQQCEIPLSKRLIDFCSGLTYGLNGSMQWVADKAFILIPAGVEFTAEEKRRLRDKGFFFNQY